MFSIKVMTLLNFKCHGINLLTANKSLKRKKYQLINADQAFLPYLHAQKSQKEVTSTSKCSKKLLRWSQFSFKFSKGLLESENITSEGLLYTTLSLLYTAIHYLHCLIKEHFVMQIFKTTSLNCKYFSYQLHTLQCLKLHKLVQY